MNGRRAVIAACSTALILQGCATASKDLSATYVSPLQYQSYDCDQLRAEAQRIQGRVVQLGGRLDEAANNDKGIAAVGIILFWPALFALGGTKQEEAEYSRLKGEYDAVEQQAIIKKCSGIAPSATMAAGPVAAPGDAIATPVAGTVSGPDTTTSPPATPVTPIASPAQTAPAPMPASPTPVAAVVPQPVASSPPAASSNAQQTAASPRLAPAAPAAAGAPAPAVQPVGLKQPSRHQFSAERFAKESGCASPTAVMTIKQFESETFTINCADGNALVVRCDGSTCRALQ